MRQNDDESHGSTYLFSSCLIRPNIPRVLHDGSRNCENICSPPGRWERQMEMPEPSRAPHPVSWESEPMVAQHGPGQVTQTSQENQRVSGGPKVR